MTETLKYKSSRCMESCGVRIEVDSNGFRVSASGKPGEQQTLNVEIYRGGHLMKLASFWSARNFVDALTGLDPTECGVRVLDTAGIVLAALDVELDPYPFMRPQGEQVHITENYVSVPPALTITDDAGDIWTLGMKIAPRERSPDGEFAFPVLRNGVDQRELASRIERRAGKVKIFTCEGWKVWTGTTFF